MTEEDRKFIRDAFTFWVRSGFEDPHELIEEIALRTHDLVGEAPSSFHDELKELVQSELEAQRAREATWEDETVNDRLEEAFAELWDRGIVALQNAGYTMAEGWEDVADAREQMPEARGAVFFHQQDTERAVDGKGLLLAFGSFAEGEEHKPQSLLVGQEVCDVLRKHGVEVSWDGNVDRRIEISPFPWRNRMFTSPP
jgi:hypothetical protein